MVSRAGDQACTSVVTQEEGKGSYGDTQLPQNLTEQEQGRRIRILRIIKARDGLLPPTFSKALGDVGWQLQT